MQLGYTAASLKAFWRCESVAHGHTATACSSDDLHHYVGFQHTGNSMSRPIQRAQSVFKQSECVIVLYSRLHFNTVSLRLKSYHSLAASTNHDTSKHTDIHSCQLLCVQHTDRGKCSLESFILSEKTSYGWQHHQCTFVRALKAI